MKARTERVATYVSPEDETQWQKEARQADKSLSQWVYDRVQEARAEDTMDQKIRELSAEERLEQLTQDGQEQLLAIAREIEERNDDMGDMAAFGAVYPIVNFRVLKRLFSEEIPEEWISDQFSEASQKLRADVPHEPERSGSGSSDGRPTDPPTDSQDSPEEFRDKISGSSSDTEDLYQ